LEVVLGEQRLPRRGRALVIRRTILSQRDPAVAVASRFVGRVGPSRFEIKNRVKARLVQSSIKDYVDAVDRGWEAMYASTASARLLTASPSYLGSSGFKTSSVSTTRWHQARGTKMGDTMPAGWNIRVTTFDSEGKPRTVRNFLAYEPDKERAIELVRKRVPVNEGELAEAVAEVTGNQFVGPGMRPGDVRRHIKKADPDEE
jgi:hypothetical protein